MLIGARSSGSRWKRYVRGVVSAEMPSSWPLAALEAQAVASRTYALTAHAGGSRFDVYADTRSQVYRGVAAETPQTNAAVAATAGQIVTYDGTPGDHLLLRELGRNDRERGERVPRLCARALACRGLDPYDHGPPHEWRLSMSFAAAAARLKGLVQGSLPRNRGAETGGLAANRLRLRARIGRVARR